MPNFRNYSLWYDASTARALPSQGDNPGNDELLPIGAINRRMIRSPEGLGWAIGDLTVNSRGAKNIVWSSEGYVWNGITISAVTTAAKKLTGSSAAQATTQALPSGMSVPTTLDVSAYRSLVIVASLASLTGTGTPSWQPELDFIDDAPSPNVIAVWKPTALTAAGAFVVNVGLEATGTPPSAPSGYTFTNIAMAPTPQVKFAWTNVTTSTTCVWTAIIYGIN